MSSIKKTENLQSFKEPKVEFTSRQSSLSLYSDLYKDVWGTRPRNLKMWEGREEALEIEIVRLQNELDSILERERNELKIWSVEQEISSEEICEEEIEEITDPEDEAALEMQSLEMRLIRGEQINF